MKGQKTKRRVVITSMGAVTAAGPSVHKLWESVRDGKSAVSKLDGEGLTDYIGARIDRKTPPEYGDVDRSISLALQAAEEAVSNSGLPVEQRGDVSVFIGSAKGGILSLVKALDVIAESGGQGIRDSLIENIFPASASSYVARRLGLGGLCQGIVSSCTTGIHSIVHAARYIAGGRGSLALAGGAEASITPLMLAAYDSMGVLSHETDNPGQVMKPFDKRRDGFAVGEGAGVLLIESLDSAMARKAAIHAEITGWAYGCEAYGITSHRPDGSGIAEQIKLALRRASLKPDDVQYINAHGTATKHNDLVEAKAIKTAFGDACREIHISSTKPVTGHTLGASGSIEAIITVLAIKNSTAPPTINLTRPDTSPDLNFTPLEKVKNEIDCAMTLNYGFGGHIGVLILSSI